MTETTNSTSPTPLFSQPRMVADLLRGYVREPWVERLDLCSLERWPEARLAEIAELRHLLAPHEGDLAWRLRWRGGRTWLYLLLAFPPEVDRWLALRLFLRVCLLYEDLLRTGELPRSRRLPQAVPLVIYGGEALWTAPRELAELFDVVPPAIDRYLPHLRYRLLDSRREPIPGTARRDNLASLYFELERSAGLDEIACLARRLAGLLSRPEDAPLREAFTAWLDGSLLPRRCPGAALPRIGDLAEAGPLLRETVLAWTGRWHEQRRGMAGLLARLLEQRFGALPETDRERIAAASDDELLDWAERSATATSLPEVFLQA